VASTRRVDAAAEPVGRFHAWWRGDPAPFLPPLPGLSIAAVADIGLLAALAGIDAAEARERLRRRHQPWLARIAGEPVGWGWLAAGEASIGELGITRRLPPGDRYLWDFTTLPAWRGRGVYPRLLQAMIAANPDVARFWIGHDLPNLASARGIAKAGFQDVGVLYRRADGGFALEPTGSRERAAAAAALFGVPIGLRRARSPG
jgi:GNAT superfamily N-acetyltransferase